jgi:Family of unknown function (DUF6522)
VPGEEDVAPQIGPIRDYFTDGQTYDAIMLSKDNVLVKAEFVAEKLGLTPDFFWREMKRGIVHGVVERGDGDDAGRVRLTFRYRARSWSVTLQEMLNDKSLE